MYDYEILTDLLNKMQDCLKSTDRPIMISGTKNQIEKLFKRVV